VPVVIVALLLSVIVPAFEMGRVMRLLSEIREIIGPVPEVSYRLEEVAGHEKQSLFVNAVLVVVALGAIAAVVSVSIRERRLAAILRRRVDEESAMARMARTLSEATSIDEAVERILAGTTRTMQGVGVYVEIRSREDRSIQSAALMRGGPVVRMGVHEGLPIPLMDDVRAENDPDSRLSSHPNACIAQNSLRRCSRRASSLACWHFCAMQERWCSRRTSVVS
jgi:hypothetical protein